MKFERHNFKDPQRQQKGSSFPGKFSILQNYAVNSMGIWFSFTYIWFRYSRRNYERYQIHFLVCQRQGNGTRFLLFLLEQSNKYQSLWYLVSTWKKRFFRKRDSPYLENQLSYLPVLCTERCALISSTKIVIDVNTEFSLQLREFRFPQEEKRGFDTGSGTCWPPSLREGGPYTHKFHMTSCVMNRRSEQYQLMSQNALLLVINSIKPLNLHGILFWPAEMSTGPHQSSNFLVFEHPRNSMNSEFLVYTFVKG